MYYFFWALLAWQPKAVSDELALSAAANLISTKMHELQLSKEKLGELETLKTFSEAFQNLTRKSAREQRLRFAWLGDQGIGEDNQAEGEALELLRQMRADAASGKLAAVYELETAKYVPLKNTGACLSCHGQPAKAELEGLLTELYPSRFKGYREGDVIGAVRVTYNAHLDHD